MTELIDLKLKNFQKDRGNVRLDVCGEGGGVTDRKFFRRSSPNLIQNGLQ